MHETARLLADQLGLVKQQYGVVSSRLGRAKWLYRTYTEAMAKLAQTVDVICPGTPATVWNAGGGTMEGKKPFLKAGGKAEPHSCLDDDAVWITALRFPLTSFGWPHTGRLTPPPYAVVYALSLRGRSNNDLEWPGGYVAI
jgi:protoheme ferro-lyase